MADYANKTDRNA